MNVTGVKTKKQPRFYTGWVANSFILLVIVMGALHTWAAVNSYSMNADGISYLDIGDAYFTGDWENAINPVWSPMYSWVLGLALYVFKPPMAMEFRLVHLVNYSIYLTALASFLFFWKQVLSYQQLKHGTSAESVMLPAWAMYSIGILLFIWASLTLIEIWAVTPDMLMAAIIFLAAALLLRMRMSELNLYQHALFGFLLGVGFLTKTVMLPISFLFLIFSLLSLGAIQRKLPKTLLALIVFLLVAGPFIALISHAKGNFTFGESGNITYIRLVNGIPYPHWQGGPPGFGAPIHPSRQVFADPPIYEFATPIGGTYPITYDPSYWYEGVTPSYRLGDLLPAVLSNLQFYLNLLFRELGPFMAIVLFLYLLTFRPPLLKLTNLRYWTLAILSLLAMGLYMLVYVEGRYIAVFVLLIAADLLANLAIPDTPGNRRLLTSASLVLVFFLLGNLTVYNLEGFDSLLARPSRQGTESAVAAAPSWPGQVAEELASHGITEGDRVGVIGYAFDSFWARLARVKIVAEMFEWQADPFYLGDINFQTQVIQAFASAGASAVVAEYVPAYASLPGWHQVGDSNYYIYLISQ
jgi:hypothetical protein